MSLYQCEECGCIENTACGHYHCRGVKDLSTDPRALCSVCGPKTYPNGEPTEYGEWHGRFERKFYPKGTLETDKVGNIKIKDNFTISAFIFEGDHIDWDGFKKLFDKRVKNDNSNTK